MSAIDQIKIDEGFRGQPYKCSAGKTTIGYGRNLEANPLTKAEAQFLLENDLKKTVKKLSRYGFYTNSNPQVRAILINMAFNMGINGLTKFKKMISALESKDYAEAATQMLDSKWAKQVGNRAKRLANQMRLLK